jgi:hypothetical protein
MKKSFMEFVKNSEVQLGYFCALLNGRLPRFVLLLTIMKKNTMVPEKQLELEEILVGLKNIFSDNEILDNEEN